MAIRQGNYGMALHEFELARAKEPSNPYWRLYRLTAARLAGGPAEPGGVSDDGRWPAALLAYHFGQLAEETLLGRADSAGRRAEALFQMGVLAVAGNPAVARRHWQEVINRGTPALMEYAAASNELARLGS